MAVAIMAEVKRFYKVYIDDEDAAGKSNEELEAMAMQRLKDEGLNALSFDDTPFEPENDVISLWYDYAWNDGQEVKHDR